MKCYFEIDFLKRVTSIERTSISIETELKRKTISIDRIVALWLAQKARKTITIDRFTYKVIRVNIPVPFDFVYLQNEFLPNKGEYFLN